MQSVQTTMTALLPCSSITRRYDHHTRRSKNIQTHAAATNIHQRTSAIPTAPNPLPTFEKILKPLDDLISRFLDLPLRPSLDPKHVLSGNFAPVPELPPTECETLEGSLPSSLNGGAYIRNGPNPQFTPNGPYHLFDGDGMLHVVKISGGKTVFCSRYVETYKYLVERHLGYPIFISPFSSFNGVMASLTRCVITWARILTKCFNPGRNGLGTANTSVALLGGKLFALCESDLPYEVKLTWNGDVRTVSRRDFGMRSNPFSRMTAHPKTDVGKGEAFAFRCGLKPPFLVFFRIDSNGEIKGPDLPILSMRGPSFVHDFALTEKNIVFEETQFVVDVMEMIVRGKSLPLRVDEGRTPRVGILPRDAVDESELTWIDAHGLNMMHLVNAWEEDEGDKIVIIAPNAQLNGKGLESLDSLHSVLEKITIDVKERTVRRRDLLSTKTVDFAAINPRCYGRNTRYVYGAISSPTPKVSGILKIDTSSNWTVASRSYGPGCYGGEPFFVANDDGDGEEDDGYLVTYLHDENKQESYFLVMDAKSPALDVVARVRLPQRVPYGFHGLFVRECDLSVI